jgi:hypothetical protein
VYARGRCVRHGGKKQCQFENCKNTVHGGNFCASHGGLTSKRFCSVEGCMKQAHARKRCVRHGGGRLCGISGCLHHARVSGFCYAHSHPVETSTEIAHVMDFLQSIDEDVLDYLQSVSTTAPSSPNQHSSKVEPTLLPIKNVEKPNTSIFEIRTKDMGNTSAFLNSCSFFNQDFVDFKF